MVRTAGAARQSAWHDRATPGCSHLHTEAPAASEDTAAKRDFLVRMKQDDGAVLVRQAENEDL